MTDLSTTQNLQLGRAMQLYSIGSLSDVAFKLYCHLLLKGDDVVVASYASLGQAVGSDTRRQDGQRPKGCRRDALVKAGQQLENVGLVYRERQRNPQSHQSIGPKTPFAWELEINARIPDLPPSWPKAYWFVKTLVFMQTSPGPTAFATLAVLAWHAGPSGTLRWSPRWLGNQLGVHQQTATRTLERIAEMNWGLSFERSRLGSEKAQHFDIALTVPRAEAVESDYASEVIELRAKLWYSELVDEAISRCEGGLPNGQEISDRRRVHGFYLPVLSLQERYANPYLIKDALTEALSRNFDYNSPNTERWPNYLAAVCQTEARKGTSGPRPGSNADAEHQRSPQRLVERAEELLREAATLNNEGAHNDARQLVQRLFDGAEHLAFSFGGDVETTRLKLIEAWEKGLDDFRDVHRYAVDRHFIYDTETASRGEDTATDAGADSPLPEVRPTLDEEPSDNPSLPQMQEDELADAQAPLAAVPSPTGGEGAENAPAMTPASATVSPQHPQTRLDPIPTQDLEEAVEFINDLLRRASEANRAGHFGDGHAARDARDIERHLIAQSAVIAKVLFAGRQVRAVQAIRTCLKYGTADIENPLAARTQYDFQPRFQPPSQRQWQLVR